MRSLELVTKLLADSSAQVRDELLAFEKSIANRFEQEAANSVASEQQDRTSVSGTLSPIEVLSFDRTSFSLSLISREQQKRRYRRCLHRLHPRKDGDPTNTELLQVLRAAYRNGEEEVLMSLYLKVYGFYSEDQPLLEKAVNRAQGRLHRLKVTLADRVLSPYYCGQKERAATNYANLLKSFRLRLDGKVFGSDNDLSDNEGSRPA